MATELFLNFLGIRMDSRKAEGMRFTINLITPDNGEKFVIEMENATLTNLKGFLAEKPDLTLTINRSDLEQTMMGAKTLKAQIADGTAKAEGDPRSCSNSPRRWSTSTRALKSCPAQRSGRRILKKPIPTKPFRAKALPNSIGLKKPGAEEGTATAIRRASRRSLDFGTQKATGPILTLPVGRNRSVCPDGSTWDRSGLDSRWFGVVPFGPSETADVGRVWETHRSGNWSTTFDKSSSRVWS